MVVINTQTVEVQHLVDVPRADCVIATALDEYKKTKVFLIVNGEDTIYRRNGISDTWDKLEGDSKVRNAVRNALGDSRIPRYSTDGLSILN